MLIRKAEGLNHHILEINILFQWIFQSIKVRRLTSAHVYVHIIAMETFQGDHFHEKKSRRKPMYYFHTTQRSYGRYRLCKVFEDTERGCASHNFISDRPKAWSSNSHSSNSRQVPKYHSPQLSLFNIWTHTCTLLHIMDQIHIGTETPVSINFTKWDTQITEEPCPCAFGLSFYQQSLYEAEVIGYQVISSMMKSGEDLKLSTKV